MLHLASENTTDLTRSMQLRRHGYLSMTEVAYLGSLMLSEREVERLPDPPTGGLSECVPELWPELGPEPS